MGDQAAQTKPKRQSYQAFFSYARRDDHATDSWVSKLRQKLEVETSVHTGSNVVIYQDTASNRTGERWQERVNTELLNSFLLIAVLTPSFFASENCLSELATFMEHGRCLGQSRVFPLYLITCDEMSKDISLCEPLVRKLRTLHWMDIRHLRAKRFDANIVKECLCQIASDMAKVLLEFETLNSNDSESKKKTLRNKVTVGKGSGFDYMTITEAVRSVSNGGEIIIDNGIYDESINVQQPVRLTAHGSVTIRSEGDYCLSVGADARIHGLNFDHRGLTGSAIVAVSELRLASAHVTSLRGIGLVGYSNRIFIKHCRVQGCGSAGILCSGSKAVILNVHIGNNAGPGLEITNGSIVTLGESSLSSGTHQGIKVFGGGRCRVSHCSISGHTLSGVEVSGATSHIVLRNSKICGGQNIGLSFLEGASGLVANCSIFENAFSQVEIKSDANPRIRDCKIYSGPFFGIFINARGRGTILNNEIYGHGWSGVSSQKGAAPLVQGNRIHDNKLGGIYVIDEGGGKYLENSVFRHELSGATIRESKPTLIANTFSESGEFGLEICKGSAGVFRLNTFTENGLGDIAVDPESSPVLERHPEDVSPVIQLPSRNNYPH